MIPILQLKVMKHRSNLHKVEKRPETSRLSLRDDKTPHLLGEVRRE